jgi:hypothetical protein
VANVTPVSVTKWEGGNFAAILKKKEEDDSAAAAAADKDKDILASYTNPTTGWRIVVRDMCPSPINPEEESLIMRTLPPPSFYKRLNKQNPPAMRRRLCPDWVSDEEYYRDDLQSENNQIPEPDEEFMEEHSSRNDSNDEMDDTASDPEH